MPVQAKEIAATGRRRSERALIAAACAGDSAAFAALYREHKGRVHALCWRLSGANESLAQELTQDAFVRAWDKLATFRGGSAFSTWLHRLTVNVALGDRRIRLRRADREQSLEAMLQIPASTTEARHGDQMDLEQVIAKLPERARTVLVLHDIEGYRHDEIAALADMAVGTSKAQLHRARKLLRQWLEQ